MWRILHSIIDALTSHVINAGQSSYSRRASSLQKTVVFSTPNPTRVRFWFLALWELRLIFGSNNRGEKVCKFSRKFIYFQCAPTGGACPDERIGGQNNALTPSAQATDGITRIKYARALNTSECNTILRWKKGVIYLASISVSTAVGGCHLAHTS